MIMFDVRKVANAVLDRVEIRNQVVTNMALNKLVYFAHGWHLALFDKPLIDSPFEAWQWGPVHPQIYRQFKSFGDKPIRGRALRLDLSTGYDIPVTYEFDGIVSSHIQTTVDFYGGMTAARLSSISHEEGAPWDLVWNAAGSRPGMILSDEVTREYYKSKLKRPT